jgi:hypothetical protein
MAACGTYDVCLTAMSRFYVRNFLILFLGVFGPIHGSSQADSTGFGKTDKISAAFKGEIFLLPVWTSKLPDFDTLKSSGTIYTKTINVPPQSWDVGFPGVTDRFEWFGIVYRGNFKINTPGVYQFHLLSDDGSKLFIDDSLIINNDGQHGPQSVTKEIALDGSDHKIEVQYFQGPRVHVALQLSYGRKDEKLKIFPGDDFILSTPEKNTAWLWWLIPVGILLLFLIYRYRKNKQSAKDSNQPSS